MSFSSAPGRLKEGSDLHVCMYLLIAVPRDDEEQVKAYQELRSLISEQYCPLHPDLYQLRGWQVAESFRQAVLSGDQQSMRTILTEERPGGVS